MLARGRRRETSVLLWCVTIPDLKKKGICRGVGTAASYELFERKNLAMEGSAEAKTTPEEDAVTRKKSDLNNKNWGK